jgi:hypothetical protein
VIDKMNSCAVLPAQLRALVSRALRTSNRSQFPLPAAFAVHHAINFLAKRDLCLDSRFRYLCPVSGSAAAWLPDGPGATAHHPLITLFATV